MIIDKTSYNCDSMANRNCHFELFALEITRGLGAEFMLFLCEENHLIFIAKKFGVLIEF